MPPERSRTDPRRLGALALALLALAGGDARAQADARPLSVTPTFSAVQTWTDNRTLSDVDQQSDFVTRLTPGVRLQSRSGAVTGVLDYQLSGVIHRKFSELNQTQHTFGSSIVVQPADDRFTVAARGSYSRQTISAFGVQPADPNVENRNTTDVASASIAPRLKGNLGGLVDYSLLVARDITRARATDAGDSTGTTVRLSLSGRSGRLGWGLDGVRERVAYRRQPTTTDDRAFASVRWFPDADLQLSLRGGVDRSDALGGASESRSTWGGGVAWSPSPRTTLNFDADRRYFGNAHSLAFDYRTARTLWRIVDSRSASSFSGSAATQISGLSLAREYFRSLFGNVQLTDAEVIRLARVLLPNLNLESSFDLPFLVSSRSLTRQSELVFMYTGLRSSFGLSAFRSQSDSLQSTDLFGDFTIPSVRMYGATATANHRLGPRDTVSVVGSWQRTPDSGSIEGNTLKSINLLWSTQPARRTSVTFGARHVIFDGPSSYDETGLNASLSLQF